MKTIYRANCANATCAWTHESSIRRNTCSWASVHESKTGHRVNVVTGAAGTDGTEKRYTLA